MTAEELDVEFEYVRHLYRTPRQVGLVTGYEGSTIKETERTPKQKDETHRKHTDYITTDRGDEALRRHFLGMKEVVSLDRPPESPASPGRTAPTRYRCRHRPSELQPERHRSGVLYRTAGDDCMDTALHRPEPLAARAVEPADTPGVCADHTTAVPDDQDRPAANGGAVHAPDRAAPDRAESRGG